MELFSIRIQRTFQLVSTNVAKSKAGNTTIWLNRIHFKEFFKQLWQKVQKTLGLDKGRGFHL